MVLHLSVSQQIPSSLDSSHKDSASSHKDSASSVNSVLRHRRSLSDTLLLKKIEVEYSHRFNTWQDDIQPRRSSTSTPSPTTQISSITITLSETTSTEPWIPTSPALPLSSSIPIPPPPPPLIKANKRELVVGGDIAQYNINDGASTVTIPPPPPPPLSLADPMECPVCQEETTDTFRFLPCDHVYCIDCVKEYTKTLVNNGQKLSCLHFNCKSELPQDRVRTMMDEITYKKYKLFLQTPAGAHRWCPSPGCDTPYIKADCSSSSPQVTCKNNTCSLVFCYNCRVKWHDDMSCEEYKAQQEKQKTEEELLSETYAKENLQECPNCNIWVEKIDGCEYVMCTVCHHEFCWDCLEPHDHNIGTHKHGPRYKPRSYPARRRQPRAVRVAKYTGIGIAACVLGPPALVLGAAAAVVVLPAIGIGALAKYVIRKKRAKAKKKKFGFQ